MKKSLSDIKKEEILYQEMQSFKQKWLKITVYSAAGLNFIICGWGLVQQLIFHEPFGNNPAPDAMLIIFSCLMLIFSFALIYFFNISQLQTYVTYKGIYVRFFPMQIKFRVIEPNDIDKFEIRKFSPMRDFGGWGIRYSTSTKTIAYIAIGENGVEFHLKKSAKAILIGSQSHNEFFEKVNRILKFN